MGNLLLAARDVGIADAPRRARLETLLTRAVDRFGEGPAAQSARCTFGLAQGLRMRPAQERRRAAAHAQSLSVERFRRAQEPELIEQVAVEILAMVSTSSPVVPEPHLPAEPDHAGHEHTSQSGSTVRVTTLDDETEFSLRHLLDGARRVAVYGKTWVNLFNQHARHLAQIVADGGEVRVVLLRPGAGVGAQVYRSELWSGSHILIRNLAATHDRLHEIGRAAAGSGVFEVRETEVLPQFGFVATSSCPGGSCPGGSCPGRCCTGDYERGIAQLNFAFTRVEADRPVLCLEEGSAALAVFTDEFEAAWENAEPWGPAA